MPQMRPMPQMPLDPFAADIPIGALPSNTDAAGYAAMHASARSGPSGRTPHAPVMCVGDNRRTPAAILAGRIRAPGGAAADASRIKQACEQAQRDGLPVGPIPCEDRMALKRMVTLVASDPRVGGGGWGIHFGDPEKANTRCAPPTRSQTLTFSFVCLCPCCALSQPRRYSGLQLRP
jgi:hypothetical protein